MVEHILSVLLLLTFLFGTLAIFYENYSKVIEDSLSIRISRMKTYSTEKYVDLLPLNASLGSENLTLAEPLYSNFHLGKNMISLYNGIIYIYSKD